MLMVFHPGILYRASLGFRVTVRVRVSVTGSVSYLQHFENRIRYRIPSHSQINMPELTCAGRIRQLVRNLGWVLRRSLSVWQTVIRRIGNNLRQCHL